MPRVKFDKSDLRDSVPYIWQARDFTCDQWFDKFRHAIDEYLAREINIAVRLFLGDTHPDYDNEGSGPALDIRFDRQTREPELNFSPGEPLDYLQSRCSLFEALCEGLAWTGIDEDGPRRRARLRAVLAEMIEIIDGKKPNPVDTLDWYGVKVTTYHNDQSKT